MKRFSLNSIGVLLGIVVYIAVGYILALLFGLLAYVIGKIPLVGGIILAILTWPTDSSLFAAVTISIFSVVAAILVCRWMCKISTKEENKIFVGVVVLCSLIIVYSIITFVYIVTGKQIGRAHV